MYFLFRIHIRATAHIVKTNSNPGVPPVSSSSDIVTVAESVLVSPLLSVTVSITVYVPALLYLCVGNCPIPVAPSPKSHVYDAISSSPFGSLLPELLNVINCPVVPVYGPFASATGALLSEDPISTVVVATLAAPSLSITTRETSHVPGL